VTYWLRFSEAEHRAATTCDDCGGPGADIICGLCYDCFWTRHGYPREDEPEPDTRWDYCLGCGKDCIPDENGACENCAKPAA
jgi:hypothetical protein